MSSNNDAFANRILLSGSSGSTTGNNIGATSEAGEAIQSGAINSVWWSWIAPSSGNITLDTLGSNFDTYLSVYTGTTVNNLTRITQNDDIGNGISASRVSFAVTAGTTYQIAVDGYQSSTGNVTLNYSFTPSTGISKAGDLDFSFGNSGKVITDFGSNNDSSYSVALQPDGKIVVVGGTATDNSRFALARYNPNGTLDTTFGNSGKAIPNTNSAGITGRSVAIQSDGKIVIAGSTSNGGRNYFALTRYNSNGSIDISFGDGGTVKTLDNEAMSVALQSDGKIVVAGSSQSSSKIDFSLTRYNNDGSLDTSFGTGGKVITSVGNYYDSSSSVAIQSDGKIVIAGLTLSTNTASNSNDANFALIRYNTNGTLDTNFGNGGKVVTDFGNNYDYGYSVVIQSDGKIVVAGSANFGFGIARYNSNGTLDSNFGSGGKVVTQITSSMNSAGIESATIQPDGKIVVAGYAWDGTQKNFAVARYNVNGTLDNSFGNGGWVITPIGSSWGDDGGKSVVIQPDGNILVAGGSYGDFALVRYLGTSSNQTHNTAPTLSDTLVILNSVNENTGVPSGTVGTLVSTLVSLGKNVSDPDTNAVAGIAITSANTTNGTWYYSTNNGTNWNLLGAVSPSNARLLAADTNTRIYFQPNANFNGNIGDAIAFRAWDRTSGSNGGTFNTTTNGGTTAFSTATDSATITVTPANRAPAIDLSQYNPTYVENASALLIAANSKVEDPDSPNFNTGNLTVSISRGGTTGDRVAIQHQGMGTNLIGVSGNSVFYSGQEIGKFTGGNGVAPLVVNFNANATPSAVHGLINNITFANVSENPSTAPRTISFVVTDDKGATSPTVSKTVNVTAVNDTPVITPNQTFYVKENASQGTVIGAVVATDLDGTTTFSKWSIGAGNIDRDRDGRAAFSINYTTGEIAIDDIDDLNPQTNPSVNLQITVSDGMNGSASETVVVKLASKPGDLDPSFGNGGKVLTDLGSNYDGARSVAIQPDGKIVVLGYTDNSSTFGWEFALTRYNANGSLDTSFGNLGKVITPINRNNTRENSVVIQPDGKIVIAGAAYSNNYLTVNDFVVARYNANGTPDTSFGNGGKVITPITLTDYSTDEGYKVALQPDGKIVVAGATSNGTDYDIALTRYNSNGSLDTGFGIGGKVITSIANSSEVSHSVVIQSDGKILVAGGAQDGTNSDFALIRYNLNGTLDTSFGIGGRVITDLGSNYELGYDVAMQSNGKIVVAGQSNSKFALARYNPNGSLDTSFGNGGKVITDMGGTVSGIKGLVILSDDKIVVGGHFFNGNELYTGDFALAAYNPDGSLDTSFGNGGKAIASLTSTSDVAYSLAAQPDRKIVVVGTSYNINGGTSNDDFAVARFLGPTNSGATPLNVTYHRLGTSDFSQDWSNSNLITTHDDWSRVPSIRGFQGNGLVNNSGTDPQSVVSNGSATTINVHANQTNPSTFIASGIAEFALSNPTVALRASSTANAPHLVLYLDATGRQNIRLNYTLRDIDTSSRNTIQPVTVQYRIGDTGNFINLPTGFVSDASNSSSTLFPQDSRDIRMSVVLPTEANNQAKVQVRFITTDAVGDDEWIGIDDIRVTSRAVNLNALPVAVNDTYIVSENTSLVTAATTTSLIVDSDRGNHIGQSDYYSYTFADGTFNATRNSNNGVTISFNGQNSGESWYLDFVAPNKQMLSPGTYTGAVRSSSQPTVPNFNISGMGRGYSQLTGEFTVNQVVYGVGNEIVSFDASFRANGDSDPVSESLRGRIQHRATPSNLRPGVLTNDTDSERTALKATLVSNPANGTLVFNPDGSFNYTPNVGFRGIDTFRYRANDSIADSSNIATVTLKVGVSDAPIMSLPGTSYFYTENAIPIAIAPSATVTDPDSPNFANGQLAVSFSNNGTINDRLAIRHQGTGANQIGISGNEVIYNTVSIGTFTGGGGTRPLAIAFNDKATPIAVQALLANITFANVSDNPTTTPRTVSFVLTDGNGGTSATVNKTIYVAAVNDAPAIVPNQTFSVNKNAPVGTVVGTVVATDSDNTNLSNWRIIAGNFDRNSNGKAAFTIKPTTGEIAVNDSNDLNFENNSNFQLQITVSDGIINSATQTVTITQKAVNTLNGTSGNDSITGTPDNDIISGYEGNDTLFGAAGDDTLNGGASNDSLSGGSGADIYVLASGQGTDTIYGYEDGVDKIALSGGLTYGALTISYINGSTHIQNTSTSETLAILNDINSNVIWQNDFTVLNS